MKLAAVPLPVVMLGCLLAFAWAGPLMHHVDPDAMDLRHIASPSSLGHPLGTDESGRDVLARLMAGGRVSLAVGTVATAVALVLGTLVGALAGWRGGWVDGLLMRVTDAAMAVPVLFAALAVLSIFGSSPPLLIGLIGATSWMGIARLVRAEVAVLRHSDFVMAARALGRPDAAIVLRHLLPQLLPVLTVAASVEVAYAILTESALSYLGLGVQPPRASWGNMLTGAQASLYTAPRLAIWPGVMILLTTLSCNGLGRWLRRKTGWHE
ncbi:MAG TPA: ABC transporter permease [Gemmatimonadales bacterium]|nr:ABC transporter permease [Gemmatimonadales bacterium]